MKKQYLKLCKNIVEFLYNSQIKIDNKIIYFKKNKNFPTEIVSSSKLKIKFPEKEYTFYFFLNKNKQIFVNKISDFTTALGPYNKGDLFRLDPFPQIKEDLKNEQKFTKRKLVKRVLFQLLKISDHLKYGLINYENKQLIKDFLNKFRSTKVDFNSGGLLFKYVDFNESLDKLEISCYDNGGIFDKYINGEGKQYTPRVMGAYYADAYAAYCFAKRYIETKNKKYLNASIACLNFIKKTYENYPKSFIWYHHDFKNPAYIETINLLKKYINKEKLSKLESLIPKLREDLYEPINVFALRYHWRTARKYLGYKDNINRIRGCIKIIKKNQTKDGLIKDNNKEDYKNALDLTYHQYSLACLARALRYTDDKNAKEIFLRGIDFSSKIITPNGEISYNGRGANNIYHLASAIYAFEIATNLTNKNYQKYNKLMFNYLKKWQNKDGSFPVAMNKYKEERMAWNHCYTPYNALTCYMLYNAAEETKKIEDKIEIEKKENIMNNSGYAMFINKNYYFGFFSGCNKSYAWSEGTHISGIAGCSIIGTKDKGTFNLILDESIKDNLIVSDLPTFFINGHKETFYGRGQLTYKDYCLEYKKKLKGINLIRKYYFENKKIKIITKIKIKKDCNLNCDGLIKFPEFKKGINIKVINLQESKDKDIKYISSNPRGKGRMYLIGKIINKPYKKEDLINYEYEINF